MRMRERSVFDFYKTPAECVSLIKNKVNNAWEICAGDGIFKDVLGEKIIKMSDINPRRNDVEKIDFLTSQLPKNIKMIVTNPPFSNAGDIIRKIIFEFKLPALMLIRIEWLSGMKNKDIQNHIKYIGIVSNLVKFEADTGRIVNGNGTGRVAWCLFTPNSNKNKEVEFLYYNHPLT